MDVLENGPGSRYVHFFDIDWDSAWDFSLVDPDNRRPVDFSQHMAILDEIKRQEKTFYPLELIKELLRNKEDGRRLQGEGKVFYLLPSLTIFRFLSRETILQGLRKINWNPSMLSPIHLFAASIYMTALCL